jgi:hypothetical protein
MWPLRKLIETDEVGYNQGLCSMLLLSPAMVG